MNDEEHNPHRPVDQQLWQRLRPSQPQPLQERSEVDPNDLAAYLDGRADQALVERIEERMSHQPELLEAVIELRQLRDEHLTEPAPRVLRQAMSLVPEPARIRLTEPAPQPSPAEMGLTAAMRWWLGSRWAAAAILVLLACLSGYVLGQGTLAGQQTSDLRSKSPALLDWSDRTGDAALGLNNGNSQPGGDQ